MLSEHNLADEFSQLQRSFEYYRVFSLPSTDSINGKQRSSILATLRGHLNDSRILLVYYNTENAFIFIDSKYNLNEESTQEPIFVINNQTDFKQVNSFDRTFGEYERIQPFVIQRVHFSDESMHGWKSDGYLGAEAIWMHYYYFRLNNSFINMTWIDFQKSVLTKGQCTLRAYDYFKEIFTEYQCRTNKKL